MPSIPDLVERTRERPGVPGARAARLYRWALSLAWAMVRYLLHRVPLFRRGRRGVHAPVAPDLDRDLPGDPRTVQRAADGHGPLCHRRYRVAFTDSPLSPAEVIARLRDDLNAATPAYIARFEPLDPDAQETPPVEVGEEYLVHLPGPWNGPVRVVQADDTSFTLATLVGHMEAGQITFRAEREETYGWTAFEIESFARSGSRIFDVLYRRLGLASELQLHMWSSFCEQVVELAGGIIMSSIEVDTHTYPDDRAA